jgi:hypothetical protein
MSQNDPVKEAEDRARIAEANERERQANQGGDRPDKDQGGGDKDGGDKGGGDN